MTEKVVTLEDFEGPLDQVSQGWSGNLLRYESDGNFTQFLGRLFPGDLVTKSFPGIPPQTEFLKVEFDFYEIDQWYSNTLMVFIGRETIDFGKFLPDVDEGRRSGDHIRDEISEFNSTKHISYSLATYFHSTTSASCLGNHILYIPRCLAHI
jgi:hypothetical protein